MAFFGSLLGAGACGFVLWKLLSKRVIEPKVVYEEPAKKKTFLVPGDGVYQVHEKRKCKHIDEEELAAKELKAASRVIEPRYPD